MKEFLTLAIIILLVNFSEAQQIKLPQLKNSVLIDGRVEKLEWEEAASIQVKDSLWLYLKQDDQNIYLCLTAKNKVPVLTSVDFYVTRGNELYNLHASAKLGERFLGKDNSYGEWNWWNNRLWYANVVKPDDWQTRSFLKDEAKEFQLRKSFFPSNRFRLMLIVEDPKSLAITYPDKASPLNAENWIELYW
jgi:hypothetical protein